MSLVGQRILADIQSECLATLHMLIYLSSKTAQWRAYGTLHK